VTNYLRCMTWWTNGAAMICDGKIDCRDFPFLDSALSAPGDHPLSWGLFLKGVKWPGRETDYSLPSSTNVKTGGSIPPPPPFATPSMAQDQFYRWLEVSLHPKGLLTSQLDQEFPWISSALDTNADFEQHFPLCIPCFTWSLHNGFCRNLALM
jgi:hypothetical protein